ncbi:hypothetical protein LCGC14_2929910, partial [marine sediment metagenome]
GRMRFIVAGDSRSNTHDWATVSAAILAEKPDLLVFNGDMNDNGTSDWEWDTHFMGPASAKKLLATVPFYPIWGNHEGNASIMGKFFHTPSPTGAGKNWAQQIGSVQFVGLDGRPSHRWRNNRWIDKTLAASKGKFIVFCSHYPAYSSCGNGELDSRGQPEDSGYRIARKTILPLLRKYKAAAFMVAHEHCYERSDLPGGLTQIIAAGAGAPRSRLSDDAKAQNPYSKVFARSLHYELFEVDGDRLSFTAKAPDGKVIDRVSWQARELD